VDRQKTNEGRGKKKHPRRLDTGGQKGLRNNLLRRTVFGNLMEEGAWKILEGKK